MFPERQPNDASYPVGFADVHNFRDKSVPSDWDGWPGIRAKVSLH